MTTAFYEKMMMPERIVVDDTSAGVISIFSWSAIVGAIAAVFLM
jgi:hypothetical protein